MDKELIEKVSLLNLKLDTHKYDLETIQKFQKNGINNISIIDKDHKGNSLNLQSKDEEAILAFINDLIQKHITEIEKQLNDL